MSVKSTTNRYGSVAIALHWFSAALIFGLMGAGFLAANTLNLDAKAAILSFHAPIGAVVLVLTIARICWWRFADRKPDEVAGMPRLQSLAAKSVHVLLYFVIIGLAASGIAMMVLSGAGEIIFGNAPGPLPNFWDYAPRYGHAVFARLMLLLLVAHVGAALYHQFIRKDHLMSRMGLGR